ncbi:MAG TPA: addiction module protein [Nostocaceae cyanobacterium]|nr:addiction module protein [Nostocaceae cyanobacterium]
MLSVEELIQQALALSIELRVFVVEELIASLEFDVNENTRSLWIAEANKRRDEVRLNLVELIPGKFGLVEVRKILEKGNQ